MLQPTQTKKRDLPGKQIAPMRRERDFPDSPGLISLRRDRLLIPHVGAATNTNKKNATCLVNKSRRCGERGISRFAGAHFPAAGQASHPSGGAATNTNKKTRPAW